MLLESRIERILTGVAKRRMAHVVAETDRLDEVFVEAKGPCDSSRDPGRLQRVSHTGSVVVARRIDEDLRLAFQPAERLGMQDAVAVALERRPEKAILLVAQTAARLVRPHGQRR
jgi:hypothetical protein